MTVVLAREGYPGAPRTGDVITGLDEPRRSTMWSSSTPAPRATATDRRPPAGACSRSPPSARRRRGPDRAPTTRSARISWPGMQYRTDIAAAVDHGDPMIPRYSLPEMADLFTDEAKFGAWLEVEILATEAWAELGVVPTAAAGRGARARPASTSRRSRRAS